jgi:hypothetical protein
MGRHSYVLLTITRKHGTRVHVPTCLIGSLHACESISTYNAVPKVISVQALNILKSAILIVSFREFRYVDYLSTMTYRLLPPLPLSSAHRQTLLLCFSRYSKQQSTPNLPKPM